MFGQTDSTGSIGIQFIVTFRKVSISEERFSLEKNLKGGISMKGCWMLNGLSLRRFPGENV